MKKLILILFISMFFISLVSAEIKLEPVKQGNCIQLYQSCPTCSYVDLRAINYPGINRTIETMDVPMTKTNSDFTHNFCNTTVLGKYYYTIYGDKGSLGYELSEEGSFEVTPSGNTGNSNIVFFIFIIVMIYGVTFVAFFYGKNIPITILGGMCMMFLGLYMIKNGIIIYRDDLTNYFSYVTIGIGFIMSMWAGLEQFDVI